ncbi:MAG: response regulator transcription factor, partial [Cyclobacteriaceae bacterium]|nr:response regulator transcription factor [Cyclobacteriaceae bacterium HetDA_MAG_MS6]
YEVLDNAKSGEEAIEKVRYYQPELIVADISLEGVMTGVEAVSIIYQFHQCPIIYLTSSSETTTVKKALATHPSAFLLKPFKISEFAINIDLAIHNFKEKSGGQFRIVRDSIFVPDQFLYHRVFKKDILFAQADGAYVKVFTENKDYSLTANLKTFHEQCQGPDFFRVSRKHMVNLNKVNRINGNTLYILSGKGMEHPITISKQQRSDILAKFDIIKTKGQH